MGGKNSLDWVAYSTGSSNDCKDDSRPNDENRITN